MAERTIVSSVFYFLIYGQYHVTLLTTQVDRCFERVSEGGGITR